jgi:hypothetical protein
VDFVEGMTGTPPTLPDKFKEAARHIETDNDPEHLNERLGKLVKRRPMEKSE